MEDYMSTYETSKDSDMGLASESNDRHQNVLATTVSALEEIVLQDDNNSHLNEEGNFCDMYPNNKTTEDSALGYQIIISIAKSRRFKEFS